MARSGPPFELHHNLGKAAQALGASAEEVKEVLKSAGTQLQSYLNGQYARTQETWDSQGNVQVETVAKPKSVETTIKETDIYKYVDLGTRAHPIPARNAPFLMFQWGGQRGMYQAKTEPRKITSFPGGPSGSVWFKKKMVNHPGTKARRFTETIADASRPQWETIVSKELTDLIHRIQANIPEGFMD